MGKVKKMQFTKIKLLLVLLLALALVSVIYIQLTLYSNLQHQTILDKLQRIDENSASLNEKIFKLQQGSLRNYDGIIGTVDTMKHQTAKLKQFQSAMKQHEITHLSQVLIKLGESTEQFLSINAVLNNSLVYLPVLVNEFSSRKGVQRDQTESAHQLLAQLFVYNRRHQPEHKRQVERLIEKLSASSMTEAQNKVGDLKMIVIHAQLIYKKTEQLNQASNVIFSADVRAIVSNMRKQYMDYYSEQQQQAEYLNWMVYFIAFILLIIMRKCWVDG